MGDIITDKQYDGMILENLEDLDDISVLAGKLPDSPEKEELLKLLSKEKPSAFPSSGSGNPRRGYGSRCQWIWLPAQRPDR